MTAAAPLDGLLVADFSRVLAGPLAAMTLGDLGADVIKVESPAGDETRSWSPPEAEDGTATYFLAVNRNKRSIALDLADPADRRLARELAARADVLLDNFRPGALSRLGLDPSELRGANPRLVHCSITGFGGGAGAALPGYDPLVQALSGLMSVTGPAAGEPQKAGVALVDVIAGLEAAVSILAALRVRERDGEGQRIEIDLLSSALAALVNQASGFLNAGVVPQRLGNTHPSIEPFATYAAADGPLMICAGNDRQFAALATALGSEELAADPRFAANASRVANRDALRELLEAALARATVGEWTERLRAAGVPAGPVSDIAGAFELAESLGLDPVDEHGGVRTVASPLGLRETPARTRRPPPRLDEHGAELRAWLGSPPARTRPLPESAAMAGFRPVDPRQSFPELERRVLERWREGRVFERQLAQRRDAGAPVWSFYEGPPTANGKPGSHHVLARVFKDVYPRFQAMRGRYVPRKAGWDCHGLPVELEVENELGISSKAEIEEYGIAEFNAKCRESVFRYVSDWDRLTERIGFWINLDDPYRTLDSSYIESVWWSLRQIWDSDRLYRGHKVVPYCPRCGTALSSHEVAQGYENVEDPSVYVRFPVLEVPPSDAIPENAILPGDQLLAWTTTPWTLTSNAALAVGPDVEYARVRRDGEVFVLARDLVERVLGDATELLAHVPGEALAGIRYEPPFAFIDDYGERGHTVLEADFVTTEDGTGIVHTAVAFGEDDFRLGEQYGLTLQNPVLADGTFDERITDFAGRFVKDADAEIVEALRTSGKLLRAEVYEHAYPHCWRCGTALLYYAKSSWYIRTTAVRDRMLAENEKIGWRPEHVKHGRFGKWLEGNVDWALSRERYWGTPLPVWECQAADCDERWCAGSVAGLRDRAGAVPEDLHRPYIDEVTFECDRCGGEMRRVEDVIDAWYDSGSMPFAQFGHPFAGEEGERAFRERFPADYICEGQDQTRGWFYSQLAISTLLFDQSDFRNCVCLGLILDAEGQKMSKSRGNVVDPWEVLDRHGADAFRWYYLASQQPWAGYRFSADTVGEAVRQFMLTLWNTYSFFVLYANAEGVEPGQLGPPAGAGSSSPADLDRWALSRLQGVVRTVIERMEDLDCTTAGRAIADYVDELSNWYVRLNRRRFWEGDAAAFATLRHCLIEVAKLLAPFTPFAADEIYANLAEGVEPGEVSVHLADFPEPDPALEDGELEAGVEAAMRAVELGRAARAQAKVKMRQPLQKAVIVATESERAEIERLAAVVSAELNVKELEFVSEQGELVSYSVKPNYRSLGPRFGKAMPQAAAAVEALDADHAAAAIRGERRIGINVDGSEHPLEPDDLNLVMQPLAGYEVEAEAGRAVALALELDDELRREGLAREIVHAVQNARKQAGLQVSDRIELTLGGDDELLAAARDHEGYVAGETLATTLAFDGAAEGERARIDGRELAISVRRAG